MVEIRGLNYFDLVCGHIGYALCIWLQIRTPQAVVFLISKYVSFFYSVHHLLKFQKKFMFKYLLILESFDVIM